MIDRPDVRPQRREDFPYLSPITTRWMDNDAYGHINNVVYYSFFDTAVNAFLVHAGMLDIQNGNPIGLVVESGCRYHAPIAFPDNVTAGLRVAAVGRSSVRYEIGVFSEGRDDAVADGHFVHVYVDRTTRRPMPVPDAWREKLEQLRQRVYL